MNSAAVLDRRQVLTAGLTTAAGLILPSTAVQANPMIPIVLSVIEWVGAFALGIGSSIIGDVAYDGFKALFMPDTQSDRERHELELIREQLAGLKREVQSVNKMMVRDGFHIFPARNLRANTPTVRSPHGIVYYPVIHMDKQNCCMAVYHVSQKQLLATIEGPSLVSLGELSKELVIRQDPRVVRDVLMPIGQDIKGHGTFATGYSKPDVLKTAATTITANYRVQSAKAKTGVANISVVGKKDNIPAKLLDRDYLLQFGRA
jgi:hypothetical protein